MEKTALKNSLYLKSESILKMTKNGHNAKAIARAKYSVRIKKLKLPKTSKKTFLQTH